LAYLIEFDKDAAKYIGSLDVPTKARIKSKLQEIEKDPFNSMHSKQLKCREERSARIGSYRILIEVDTVSETVHVVHAAPRGQVYKD
jgi:mRNA-degrading endonuclease RelE of RelBE toxin-antitoxin system